MSTSLNKAVATPTHSLTEVHVDSAGLPACAVAGADPDTKRRTTMTTTVTILAAPPAERITLTQLARQEGVAPSSAWRWATKGVRGIRLPTAMVGSKRVTTKLFFQTWCEQLTATANDRPVSEQAAAQPRNDEALRAERAEAELVRLGLDA